MNQNQNPPADITTRHGIFTKLPDPDSEIENRYLPMTCYRGFNMEDGVEVLWYTIDTEGLTEDETKAILAKFAQICQLKHDNIVSVLTYWEDEVGNAIHFITELMSSGALNEFLSRPGKLGRNTIARWCTQVLTGLQYLHSRDPPIIHECIACCNLYFNGNTGQVKIACWDVALKTLKKDEYLTPEMFDSEPVTALADVYGLGMCMLQLATKKEPYDTYASPKEAYTTIQQGIPPPSIELVNDPDIRALIVSCLSPKATRPSTTDLLNSPFLKANVPGLVQISKSSEEDVAPLVQAVDHTDEVLLTHKVIGVAMLSLVIKHEGRVMEVHFPFNSNVDTPESVREEIGSKLKLTEELAAKIQRAVQKYVDIYTIPTLSRDTRGENSKGLE
eukprot:c12095_g2_i1.p1 GENE.c12095_g2_i1~~c12095_g2_i1.p1  ORF type:complete len:389 (-),score=90.34 c12095_g2_i1:500-1666(-)